MLGHIGQNVPTGRPHWKLNHVAFCWEKVTLWASPIYIDSLTLRCKLQNKSQMHNVGTDHRDHEVINGDFGVTLVGSCWAPASLTVPQAVPVGCHGSWENAATQARGTFLILLGP